MADMLELSHVSKRFGARTVVDDVSFRVPEGSVFGFVGENGAGKTTTMKMILGLLRADGGGIFVDGERVLFGKNRTNRLIGYLPDVPEFYGFRTPTEYLLMCGEISGVSGKEGRQRAKEVLALVGLSQSDRRLRGFSRGMKQRLGIAQALFGQPRLLIGDEPTSALDPAGRSRLAADETSVRAGSLHRTGESRGIRAGIRSGCGKCRCRLFRGGAYV